LLPDYLVNSAYLVLGTTILSLLWGVPSAWFVSVYSFKGRKLLEWLLILPLTIPTYIMAFTYAGILDYAGPIQTLLRKSFNLNLAAKLDILNLPGAIFVLSLALFPYVYVTCRAAFLTRFQSLIEVSRMLGVSASSTFFKVILPVSRPAIIAGLTLVIMEVLNDYGAVKYYGVRTFTTGIFRSWFSYEDQQGAIYLSALLLVVVFLALGIEYWQRGKSRYNPGSANERPPQRRTVKGFKGTAILVVCCLPAILGFILPLLQLMYWSYISLGSVSFPQIGPMVLNSFTLALSAALGCVLVAVILLFALQIRPGRWLRNGSKFATMGYAVPGAVIAIGVLVAFLWIDKSIIQWLQTLLGINPGLLLTGSILGLIFAYVVRFLAVAYGPVESGFTRLGRPLYEVGQVLGAKPWRHLIRINIPLLKGVMLSAGLLVFVDVLKELPLTLILRPFNFNTLATRAFELASDELVAAAATPSLIIILTGLLPIIFLNRLITKA
jgi:iron(III) transport system permease protein